MQLLALILLIFGFMLSVYKDTPTKINDVYSIRFVIVGLMVYDVFLYRNMDSILPIAMFIVLSCFIVFLISIEHNITNSHRINMHIQYINDRAIEMMDNITVYANWVQDNYPTKESAYMQCSNATEKMVKAFPELRRVRGWREDCFSRVQHWWCETEDGLIIDPTIMQFDDYENGEYLPYDESLGEPKGKCINCGELCYEDSRFCSDECYKEHMEYMNGEN